MIKAWDTILGLKRLTDFYLSNGLKTIQIKYLKIMNTFKFISKFFLISLCILAFTTNSQAQFFSDKTDELIPEEQAFGVTAFVDDSGSLKVNWSIADNYYMYKDQFHIESNNSEVLIGKIVFPKGVIEDDPEFGETEVYFYNVELSSQLSKPNSNSNNTQNIDLELTLKGLGCNKPVGVCYPPQTRYLTVQFSSAVLNTTEQNNSGIVDKIGAISQDQIPSKSFLAYVISAFFAGILLSFTPCVLPMIPILAGVIAGQNKPTKMRSGWLAICYVAGTVLTYVAAGAIAGATGAQLQAYFQNVWVISAISGLLILLAASLFGWYTIQLPASLQTKLNGKTANTKSASISSFALGLISALVVGACVSPILILALGAAISQGDPMLGAAIMGSMAVGMGLLLIVFGFGAGWLLPKAGAWMSRIQIVFGFMVLGVAVYLLSALPYIPSLYLWSGLLLCTGFYIWQISDELESPLIGSVFRASSAALIIWGSMALIGGSFSGSDILRPLDSMSYSNSATSNDKLVFTRTTRLEEVQTLMQTAKQKKYAVMIDFYADWCIDCKRMKRTTYRLSSIKSALSGWSLIEIDVTETSKDSEQVKQFFKVFGPPATLFIATDGIERSDLRQYGYLNESKLLSLINSAANAKD